MHDARDAYVRDLGRTPPPAPDELPEGVTDHAGRGVGLRPGYDLLRLVDLWQVERPVLVSGDVHQHMWWLLDRKEDLPDPNGRRIHAVPPRRGDVELWARLVGRPRGPSPGVQCGASAAYDARVVGGLVDWVELRS